METDGTAKPDTDVAIIGAGIVGVCCALSLLSRGYKVQLIDQSEPGEGASHGNAGVISPWSFIPQALPGIWKQVPGWLADPEGPLKVRWRDSPQIAPWAMRFFREADQEHYPKNADAMARLIAPCIDLYRGFLKDSEASELIRDSALVSLIRGEPPSMDSPAWRLRSERGATIRLINRDELNDIEPAVGPNYTGAVMLSGQARALSPGRLCKALALQATRQGAQFTRSAVSGIAPHASGGAEVKLTEGRLLASHVVLAAGAWSVKLLEPLGVKLPMAGERGYHLEFNQPGVTLNNSVMDPQTKFIVSSMQSGIRAAGTSEFARLGVEPNYQRAQMLAAQTQFMLPGVNTADVTPWMGTRPSFPDSLPVIGPLRTAPNIVLAFGHSHWGMSMAPGTGLMVAEMIGGHQPFTDPEAYGPGRF
ncbi:MAG: NAD(P)/FAD-dependent oxidoreductase [Burkholderiaceae bacterium]